MGNEIANRSHAGLVLQVFEDLQLAPVVLAAWGVELATLQRLSTGVYAARLTQPLGLTIGVDVPADGPAPARFGFIVTAQGLALPNFVTAFLTPDPFQAPPPVGPGGSIAFSWLSVQVNTLAMTPIDADAFINAEVRRVPGERRR